MRSEPQSADSSTQRQISDGDNGLIICQVTRSIADSANAPLACAQSVRDGFDPNGNGAIRAILVQPDGKIVIDGDFTTLSPGTTFARNHIARLNPDGTVDAAFDPNADGPVYAIALQSDVKVLVGGILNGGDSVGGQTRNRIARLDAGTGLADSFNPDASGSVNSIVVQTKGKILVGGADSIGGQTQNRIARLDPASGWLICFNPNANGNVLAIAVAVGGKFWRAELQNEFP